MAVICLIFPVIDDYNFYCVDKWTVMSFKDTNMSYILQNSIAGIYWNLILIVTFSLKNDSDSDNVIKSDIANTSVCEKWFSWQGASLQAHV